MGSLLRGKGRQDILRAMDQASRGENADARTDIAYQKLDLQSERDRTNAGFREAELGVKTDAAVQRAMAMEEQRNIARERLGLEEKRVEAMENEKILKEAADRRKLDDTIQIQRDGINFLRDSEGMNPAKPEFGEQLTRLLGGYGRAAEHPNVKQWLEYNVPVFKETQKARLPAPVKETIQTDATGQTIKRTTEKVIPVGGLPITEPLPATAAGAAIGATQAANPTAAAAAPVAAPVAERIKFNPQTGERIVLRDGKWVPL